MPAYHALKHVSRANIVIGGDTWSFGTVEPAEFVRWMRSRMASRRRWTTTATTRSGRRFPTMREAYYPGGRDIDDIDTLEAQLDSTYHRHVKLWLSEFTVSSDHTNCAFNFAVSRTAQAQLADRGIQAGRLRALRRRLGWFNLLDDPPTIRGHLTNGLMTWNVQPKPAFYAYQHAP